MPRPAFSLLAVALLMTAACESPDRKAAADAEARLKLLQSTYASKDELCSASREVADAWLRTLDRDKFQMAKIEADLACNEAALSHLEGQ